MSLTNLKKKKISLRKFRNFTLDPDIFFLLLIPLTFFQFALGFNIFHVFDIIS